MIKKSVKYIIDDFFSNDIKKTFTTFKGILRSKILGSPERIVIEPTNKCNFKCVFCWAHLGVMKRKKGSMNFEDYKKIINDITGFVPRIDLYDYGEPLINKEIFKMIKYAGQRGIRVGIGSNAALFNEKNIKKLLESKLDIITLSLTSSSKEAYENLRTPGKFDITLRNIKMLCDMKKKLKKRKPHTILQMILTKETEKEKEDFIKLGKSLGIDEISIKSLMVDTMLPKKKQKTIYEQMIPEKEKSRYVWNENSLKLRNETKFCPVINTSTILWDGTVCQCCYDYDGEVSFGNAIKENFKKIWNNKKYKKMRRTIIKNKQLPFCKRCGS